MRRKDKEITDQAEMEDILRRNHICHLAMVDDGDPYLVPLTYGFDGKCLYIHSAKEGRKIDVLRQNDRVCFEVFCDFVPASSEKVCQKSTKYRSVIGTGRAELIEDEKEVTVGLDILMDQVYGPGHRKYVQDKVSNILIIRVTIDSLTGKRSGY